jgi:uncharacterized protein involved in response to NO
VISSRQPLQKILQLTAAGEPFRVLFPLGTFIGIIGVLLWPAYAWGWWSSHPAAAHAPIMIQGFIGCFVFGFLGTALPRMLEVTKLGLLPTFSIATAMLLMVAAHLTGAHTLGYAVFLATLTAFVVTLLLRARRSQDIPPPGFVLVILGLFSGWLGTLIMVLDSWEIASISSATFVWARLMAWQAFLTLPIMGVGAFLLPRFFGLKSAHAFPELKLPNRAWLRLASFAAVCGVLILAGFALIPAGFSGVGHTVIALTVLVYLIREVPIHQAREAKGDLAIGLRLSLAAIPTAFLLLAVFPQWRLALLHVLFIGGFGLITLIVASRVLLGHSGQSHRFTAAIPAIKALLLLTLCSLLLRVGVDLFGGDRFQFYGYSGIAWFLATSFWAYGLLGRVAVADE